MSDLNDNYYYILELFLDPAETNPDRLVALLNEKESLWRKKVNSDNTQFGFFGSQSKKWREQILQGVTESDLKRLALEARTERIKTLRQTIVEVERDGLLEQHEYDFLVKTFGPEKYFTESTIKGELHLPVFTFIPPKKPEIPAGVKIPDEMEMNGIERDLKIINSDLTEKDPKPYGNLYDLLKKSRCTDTATLRNAASDQCGAIRKKMVKTPRVDAEAQLYGKALIFFKSEESRQGYDIALLRRPIDLLKEKRFSVRALGKTVSRDDYNLSIDEVMQCGVSRQEAEWHVYEFYCNKRKCPYPAGNNPSESKIQCPNCFRLADPTASYCSCGAPLKIVCPKCGRKTGPGTQVCPGCGFAVGNMPNALIEVEHAQKALAAGRLGEAQEAIRQSEVWWPGNPEAQQLRRTLEKEREAERQLKTKTAELESNICCLIQRRALYQAQRLMTELRVVEPASPVLSGEGKRLEVAMSQVNEKLKQLPLARTPAEKTAVCEEILALASDCTEARAVMDRIPPAPPTRLQATVTPTGIQLKWEDSPTHLKTGYKVIRKRSGVPLSETDGETLIDDLTNAEFLDTLCDPGVIYGYTVFTRREKITENVGCRSELVQIVADVKNTRVLPGNKSITLGWMSIESAVGMKITRTDTESGAQKSFQMAKGNGYVDSGLENDRQYAYLIQVIYRAPDGSEVLSKGVTVNGTPRVPPTPVNNLDVTTGTPGTLEISWTPPKRGEFYLFTPKTAQDQLSGKAEFLSLIELKKRFGDYLPLTNPASGKAVWKSSTMGIWHFLPVSYDNGVVVYGLCKSISRIDNVSDIRLQFDDNDFFLTWKWPEGIDCVCVQIRRDALPTGPNDPKSERMILTRKEYDVKKAFQRSGQFKNCYFVLYSYIPTGKIYSSGTSVFTAKTSIRYDLRIDKPLFAKTPHAELVIKRELSEGGMPELEVKKEFNRPPLNREYGEKVLTIPATSKQEQTVLLEGARFDESAFIKLFIADPSQETFFSFNPPPHDELKLEYKPPGYFGIFKKLFSAVFHRR